MGYLDRFACAAMVLALSAPVWAAPTKADETRAAELKKQGDDLMHASQFKEALQKYDESFAIVANPAIQYNRGRALEKLADYPAALDALEKFSATASPELRAKVPNLDKTMAEIESHVATLVVRCDVPNATISVRAKDASTPLQPSKPFRTAPGDATVTATAPGYVAFNQDTTLVAGQTTTIDATLHKAATEPVATNAHEPTPFDAEATPPPPKQEAAPTSHTSGWKTVGWVSGGIGIAALGAGLTFFGLSLVDKNNADPHCPNKVCDATGRDKINEAWTFADVSTALVITGSVALAFSLTAFIISPKTAPVQARVFVGPGSAAIGGTF
jgi:hypothetical protein